ncbi:hypothetical protein Agub_g10086, partial [Astrephomene gubernaculifera]
PVVVTEEGKDAVRASAAAAATAAAAAVRQPPMYIDLLDDDSEQQPTAATLLPLSSGLLPTGSVVVKAAATAANAASLPATAAGSLRRLASANLAASAAAAAAAAAAATISTPSPTPALLPHPATNSNRLITTTASPANGLTSPSPSSPPSAAAVAAAAQPKPKPSPSSSSYGLDPDPPNLLPGGTLVVCPTSVLHQWAREIRDKVSPAVGLVVHVYHGKDRVSTARQLAEMGVVLTTYGTLAQEAPSAEKQAVRLSRQGTSNAPINLAADDDSGGEEGQVPYGGGKEKGGAGGKAVAAGLAGSALAFPRGGGGGGGKGGSAAAGAAGGGPLYQIKWKRVVLDEAQSIKNPRTLAARAAWRLAAHCRWCLSGTPIQNSVDDLYSYFRFLRYTPYCEARSFKQLIKGKIAERPEIGFKFLQAVLQAVLLRRTKQTTLQGEPIIRLPPRQQQLLREQFSAGEAAVYNQVQSDSLRSLAAVREGGGSSGRQFVNMLHSLLRLRQACNHPWLLRGGRSVWFRSGTASAAEVEAARRLSPETRAALLASLVTRGSPGGGAVGPAAPPAAAAAAAAAGTGAGINPSLGTPLGQLPHEQHEGQQQQLGSQPQQQPQQQQQPLLLPSPCPCCGDIAEDPVASTCGHVFCAQCLAAQREGTAVEGELLCPACSRLLRPGDLHSAAALAAADPAAAAAAGIGGGGGGSGGGKGGGNSASDEPWVSSAKVDRLMALLEGIRAKNAAAAKAAAAGAAAAAAAANPLAVKSKSDKRMAGALRKLPPLTSAPAAAAGGGGGGSAAVHQPPPDKVIVFSQWTGMLDLLEIPLKRAKLAFRRLDGTMSVAHRERAISDFERRPDVLVLLLSLKAAALGVNLTAANHVVLLDLWWNPTTEEQAIDRAHRIGQTRPVQVTRITISGSVEERILALQAAKRQLVAAALSG